jgi:serine/threonine-protein kinase
VDIFVTAPAGTYTNSVTVAQPAAATDPVAGNNAAAATFTVAPPGKCVVTPLAKKSLATAKRLLVDQGCKVGKVTKSYSRTIAKGKVIKTKPGSGSHAAGTLVAIVESKGPKPKKHKK